VALVTSLPGIQWFSKAEILSIVRETFPGVPLDTGIAGTTPLTTLLTSTTLNSFGRRFLFAITVSTSTHLWLVIGPNHESFKPTLSIKPGTNNIEEGNFGAFSLLLQVKKKKSSCKYLQTRQMLLDYNRLNSYWSGGRPDIPLQ